MKIKTQQNTGRCFCIIKSIEKNTSERVIPASHDRTMFNGIIERESILKFIQTEIECYCVV